MIPNILCVHQIGKVGSTSLVRALERILPNETIRQTHVLSASGVLLAMQAWLDHPRAPAAKLDDHVAGSIELRRHFGRNAPPVNWYLLSLVREPMARDISAFFQNLHRLWIHALSPASRGTCERVLAATGQTDAAVTAEETADLVRDLIRVFKERYRGEKYQRWFDREMRAVFGIDVFAEPFPRGEGFRIYEASRTRMVLFRLEDLPRTFETALGRFLGDSGFERAAGDALRLERVRANEGATKAYSALYRAFLDTFTMEDGELAAIYDSKAIRHFYSDGEIAIFRAKWAATPTGVPQPALLAS